MPDEVSTNVTDANNEEFYTLTLTAEDGKVVWATQTHWTGFTGENPRRELRKPRKVFAKFAELWTGLGQPFCVIRSPAELIIFLRNGGNALIEPAIFEHVFSFVMAPEVSIPTGFSGFAGLELFDDFAFKRVPTPKLRMKILNRDGRRCRICGRNPDDHLDLELHVHHILPWAKGGVTDKRNLITLCKTCHDGLDPHYDPSLFGYVNHSNLTPEIKEISEKHAKGVAEYQHMALSYWAGESL